MKPFKILALLLIPAFFIACGTAQPKNTPAASGGTTVIKEYWDDAHKDLKGQGPAVNGKEKTGKWTLYHRESYGALKLAEGNYKNNQQDGPWVFYYKNGKKSSEGSFDEGQKTGEWIEYYDDGVTKLSVCKYVITVQNISGFEMKAGGIEGKKVSYFKSGKVMKEEEYVHGLKNGRSQEYFEDGKPKEIAGWINNEKDGSSNTWWENGKPKMMGSMRKNKQEGPWKFYTQKGTVLMEGNFTDGKMEGLWREYNEEGWLSCEGSYTKSLKKGIWTYKNKQGQITQKLAQTGEMVDDQGICSLYDNGRLIGEGQMTGLAKRPKKSGKWKQFYPNGKVEFEGVFMMDKKNGHFVEYYQSGRKQAEGDYMTDKKNGKWVFYLENGTVDADKSGSYMMGKQSNF